jgi:hypothetical protein
MNKRTSTAPSRAVAVSGLEVFDYRRFKRLSLRDFRRVNLLVGPNNSGKTSVLEAIQLAALSSKPDSVISSLVDNARRRGEVGRDERGSLLADLSHAFNGHAAEIGTGFGIGRSAVDSVLMVGMVDGLKVSWPDNMPAKTPGFHNLFGIALDISFESTRQQLPLWTSGLFPPPLDTWPPMWVRNADAGAPLVPIAGLTGESMRSLWDEVIRRSREGIAVEALKLIEPRVNGIVFLTQEAGGDSPTAGILVGLDGSDSKVPLGSLGDGMARALMLALVMTRASGGVLLVDEIDTGLHYSLMPALWEFVLAASRQMNIQVFATTHSFDCIKGLGEVIRRSPDALDEVSVQKLSARLDHAVAFVGDTLLAALENDVELRG